MVKAFAFAVERPGAPWFICFWRSPIRRFVTSKDCCSHHSVGGAGSIEFGLNPETTEVQVFARHGAIAGVLTEPVVKLAGHQGHVIVNPLLVRAGVGLELTDRRAPYPHTLVRTLVDRHSAIGFGNCVFEFIEERLPIDTDADRLHDPFATAFPEDAEPVFEGFDAVCGPAVRFDELRVGQAGFAVRAVGRDVGGCRRIAYRRGQNGASAFDGDRADVDRRCAQCASFDNRFPDRLLIAGMNHSAGRLRRQSVGHDNLLRAGGQLCAGLGRRENRGRRIGRLVCDNRNQWSVSRRLRRSIDGGRRAGAVDDDAGIRHGSVDGRGLFRVISDVVGIGC